MILTAENTWKEVAEAGVVIAVVPIGAVEQHGLHLPLGTDWIIARHYGRVLAEELERSVGNVYLLPAMPYGNSREHMGMKGTITLRPATLAMIIEDIIESLRHHGIRTMVVFSSHGGNWIIKPTLRELNFKYPDITILWGDGPLPDEGDPVPEDIHAGRSETSSMLAFRPDLAKEITADLDSPGIVGQEFNDYVGLEHSTRHGAWGKPSEASADLGEEAIRTRAAHAARYILWACDKVAELRNKSDSG